MSIQRTSGRYDYVQPLEPRRLLSLTLFGTETVLADADRALAADIAVAADGSYLVASAVVTPVAPGVDPTGVIFVVRYSATGEQVGAPLTLDSTGTAFLGISSAPLAASADADGDAVVAYRRDSGVYIVRVSKDGMASAPLRVDTVPSDGILHSPAISMDDEGQFFVGWIEQGDESDFVHLRAYDAAGAPRGPQFSPASVSNFLNGFYGLDIAARPDGSGAIIAYEQAGFEGADSVQFGRVSTTALVGEFGRVGSFGADVAVHPDGSFVIGYEVGNLISLISPRHVRAQRYDAAGAAIGSPISLDDLVPVGGGRDPRTHSVSVDVMPDGGFVAAFVHTVRVGRSINPNRDFNTMYARRYHADGPPDPSGLVVLDSPPYDSHSTEEIYIRPSIGADAEGTVVVAYQEPSRDDDFSIALGPVHTRRLTGNVAVNDRGDLYVFGTDAGEAMQVRMDGDDDVVVSVGEVVRTFAAADVQHLSINGFGGDDDIDNNTAFASTIHGGDGHDTIWGGTGGDRIHGFGGGDVLRGGDGSDALFGGTGGDWLHGGNGNDYLAGDAGEDALFGASGADLLRGHHGSDTLHGEAGDDTLDSGAGGDYLEGGAGHDALIGGGEPDALFGLAGNDRLFSAGDGFRDTVRGGPGDDSADADEADDVLGVELP